MKIIKKILSIDFCFDFSCRFFLFNWCKSTNKILNGLCKDFDPQDSIQKEAYVYNNKRKKKMISSISLVTTFRSRLPHIICTSTDLNIYSGGHIIRNDLGVPFVVICPFLIYELYYFRSFIFFLTHTRER